MKVGIVGLPLSGKTTLFEAITGVQGASVEHSPTAHTATISVPDERLDQLAESVKPQKVTHAHVDFVDVAGVAGDMERERAVHILSAIREVDGTVNVVRCFDSPSAPPHPRGSLDPERDVAEMQAELLVADLDIVEKRLEKLRKQIAKFTPTLERDKKEAAVLERIKSAIEAGRRPSSVQVTAEETALLRSYQFLSDKPMLHVLNVAEGQLDAEATRAAAQKLGPDTVVICAKLEKEIAELPPEERAEFLQGMGIGEPAARKIVRACYRALGLRSFFTPGPNEVRAWVLKAGETALDAAGRIHSDLARGFIRAEVISYSDFAACGGLKEARNANKMRLEGKDYLVQDGDIILIRFKV